MLQYDEAQKEIKEMFQVMVKEGSHKTNIWMEHGSASHYLDLDGHKKLIWSPLSLRQGPIRLV